MNRFQDWLLRLNLNPFAMSLFGFACALSGLILGWGWWGGHVSAFVAGAVASNAATYWLFQVDSRRWK